MPLHRIDVHHHFVPDFYREVIASLGGDPSGWATPDWSPALDAVANQKFNIATPILSLTAPGPCILKDPQASATLARRANLLAASYRDSQPSSYGFFASLPSLLNKDLALAEIAYAFDTLKADGVTLFTRYGDDNHYLGHPDFDDIWKELNRRSAVVFIHPTHPVDTNLISNTPQPVLTYAFETTHTALDMLRHNVVKRNPNCKIILSHAGGALPYLIARPVSMFCETEAQVNEMWEQARDFYYDVALSGSENALRVLEKFAKPEHILYGSDSPYASERTIEMHTEWYDKYEFEDPGLRDKIDRENALALFPRLKE